MADNEFGERLYELRKAKKLTQPELANRAGITVSSVWFYEKGKTSPTITTLELLCKALDVTASDLLGF